METRILSVFFSLRVTRRANLLTSKEHFSPQSYSQRTLRRTDERFQSSKTGDSEEGNKNRPTLQHVPQGMSIACCRFWVASWIELRYLYSFITKSLSPLRVTRRELRGERMNVFRVPKLVTLRRGIKIDQLFDMFRRACQLPAAGFELRVGLNFPRSELLAENSCLAFLTISCKV